VAYSVITPIFEASDEVWHYPVVQYMATGHGLPMQTPVERPGLWKQQASQPPLYYALAALLTAWVDTSDLPSTLRPNPHAAVGIVTPDGNINLVAHDPAREAWPWRGTVLAVHIARLLSVAMGTATVYLTYRLGQEVFPDRLEIAWGAAAINAFTPMFVFISGSVNNDNLVILLGSLALLIMIRQGRAWQADEKRLMLGWLILGVVIGLATLTKLSGLGAFSTCCIDGRVGSVAARPDVETSD
jgi:4-amino-4-deoxy-L-arabinose transferase-like glycosyltransferase